MRCHILLVLLAVSCKTTSAFSFDLGVRTLRVTHSRPLLSSTHKICRQSSALHESSNDNAEERADQLDSDDIGSRFSLEKIYRISTVAYGAVGALILLTPSRYGARRLASKFGGAAGFGIAAAVSRILAVENIKNDLSSETTKRLSLGLLGFGVFGAFAIPAEASFSKTMFMASVTGIGMTLSRLLGVYTGYIGWNLGRDLTVMEELKAGAKLNFKGLLVKDKRKAQTYRNCLLLVLFGLFSTFQECLYNITNQEYLMKTAFEISLQASGVARLFLITSVIYSLKDAAERNILSETKFIAMNYIVAIWAFLVGLSQRATGLEMMLFSLVFAIKGYKGKRQQDGTLRVIEDASSRWKRP